MQSYSIDEAYFSALEIAKRLRLELRSGDVISFSRGGEPAASILYLASLHAGVDVRLASAVELSYHLLPYAEKGRVIIFSPKRDTRAISAAISASILGAQVVFVAPDQGAAVEERLKMREIERIVIGGRSPIMSSSLLAALSAPRLMGFREERVRKELSLLNEALHWLKDILKGLEGVLFNAVLYTPVTRAGAYYYKHAAGCAEPAPLESLAEMSAERILLLYSSVEEMDYRDVLSSRPPQASALRIDADPVTASIYSVIAAAIIAGRVV